MKRTALVLGLSLFVASIAAQTPPPAQQTPPPAGAQAAGAPAAGRQGGRGTPDPRTAGGGNCANNPYNCIDTPNPVPVPNTVFMEEMSWMDVRDSFNAGKKTVLITTGGIEPNGPWLVLGKHNYVNRVNCDAIARKLGNAMCAPNVPFVPEGGLDPKSSHMTTIGTISLTEATFAALLTDIVTSYKMHGFENIILFGDSGGNQRGMKAVADKLNADWGGKPVVAHIAEYYQYSTVDELLKKEGVIKEGMKSDGLHDDPGITLNMFMADPNSIKLDARIKAGKATINGVSLADKKKNAEWGKKIVEMRATNTVAAINKAIADRKK
jgi:creatinine amidohydrolase